MADEEIERNSPQSTSEATPPQVDDSPEMVNQPSPSEVSSSTDRQPPEDPDSPDEPGVSSTSDLGPSTQSDSDASQESGNQSQPDGPPDHAIRQLLESPPALPRTSQPVRSPVQDALVKTGLVGAAVVVPTVPAALESVQITSAAGASSQEIAKEAIQQNIEKSDDSNQQFDVDDSSSAPKSSPENPDFKSDSSPSGSDVHEDENQASGSTVTETSGLENNPSPRIGIVKENIVSEIGIAETVRLESLLSQSKTSSDLQVHGSDTGENIGLSKESSPSKPDSGIQVSGGDTTEAIGLTKESSPKTGSGIQVSGSGTTETIGLTKESSPKTGSGIQVSGSGTTETIGLTKESSPKTGSGIQVSGSGTTETIGLRKGPSPSKSGSTASDTPERRRDPFSPKRKSPLKLQHSSPKRYAPFSPDKRQSDSQVSTLLGGLDIKETENNPGSADPISEHEQEMSSERKDTDESENENVMEVQEADQQAEHEKTTKCSKNDPAKMEESD